MFLPHLCDMNPKISYNNDDIIIVDDFYKDYEARSKINKIDKMDLTQISDFKWRCNVVDKKLSDLMTVIISDKIHVQNWTFKEINENWRCVKGTVGYKMYNHLDEEVIKDENTKSFFSILIYLTDNPEGYLIFKDFIVEPKAGRVVIFNQKLIHMSEESREDKYFLHSEIFFSNQ
jgi:hypothetical protein